MIKKKIILLLHTFLNTILLRRKFFSSVKSRRNKTKEKEIKKKKKHQEIKLKSLLAKSLKSLRNSSAKTFTFPPQDTPCNGGESYSLHRFACAHDYTGVQSTRSRLTAAALVEREQVLITCLRCPRGLHATTETMNLRVPRTRVRVRASARGRPSECTCGGQE